jgi:alkylated DNA repair dioxygenase AlkB
MSKLANKPKQKIPLDNGSWLEVWPAWLTESERLMNKFAPKKRRYDNSVVHDWYGLSFSSSSVYKKPQPKDWPASLDSIKNKLEKLYPTKFNSCQLNYYYKDEDHMGWHTDYMQNLPMAETIANLSIGDTRTMVFRKKPSESYDELDKDYWRAPKASEGEVSVELGDGTLVVMCGKTQENWVHAVLPKRNGGERLSLVFRQYQVS